MSKASRMRRYRDNEYIRHTLSGEVGGYGGTSPLRPGNDLNNRRSRGGDTKRLVLGIWERDRNIGKNGSPLGKSRRNSRKLSVWETIKLAGQTLYAVVVREARATMLNKKGRGGDDEG